MGSQFAADALLLVVAGSRHEVRPAYLQLAETQPKQFSVLWNVPARGDRVLSLQAALPASCQALNLPTPVLLSQAQLSRWKVDCGSG